MFFILIKGHFGDGIELFLQHTAILHTNGRIRKKKYIDRQNKNLSRIEQKFTLMLL
jgi:hypothetical protein